jgi:hypothetical protein
MDRHPDGVLAWLAPFLGVTPRDAGGAVVHPQGIRHTVPYGFKRRGEVVGIENTWSDPRKRYRNGSRLRKGATGRPDEHTGGLALLLRPAGSFGPVPPEVRLRPRSNGKKYVDHFRAQGGVLAVSCWGCPAAASFLA